MRRRRRGAVQGDDPRARLGLRLRRATPTSSRSTSVSCASASTSRSTGPACRRCAWWATGSTRRRAEVRTLRGRTTALVVLVTGLTLVAGGWALVLTLQSRITANNDRVDQARLRDLVAAARSGDLTSTITDIGGRGGGPGGDRAGPCARARRPTSSTPARSATSPPATRPRVATVDAPDDDETERYRVWAVQRADGRRTGDGLRRYQRGVGARGQPDPHAGCCWSGSPWSLRSSGWPPG